MHYEPADVIINPSVIKRYCTSNPNSELSVLGLQWLFLSTLQVVLNSVTELLDLVGSLAISSKFVCVAMNIVDVCVDVPVI